MIWHFEIKDRAKERKRIKSYFKRVIVVVTQTTRTCHHIRSVIENCSIPDTRISHQPFTITLNFKRKCIEYPTFPLFLFVFQFFSMNYKYVRNFVYIWNSRKVSMKFQFILSVLFFLAFLGFVNKWLSLSGLNVWHNSKMWVLLKTFTLNQLKSIDIAPPAKVNTIKPIENDLHVECIVDCWCCGSSVISGLLLFLPMRTVYILYFMLLPCFSETKYIWEWMLFAISC